MVLSKVYIVLFARGCKICGSFGLVTGSTNKIKILLNFQLNRITCSEDIACKSLGFFEKRLSYFQFDHEIRPLITKKAMHGLVSYSSILTHGQGLYTGKNHCGPAPPYMGK